MKNLKLYMQSFKKINKCLPFGSHLQIDPMKKILTILFILCFTNIINAQKVRTSQDSIQVFYDKLFSAMEGGYLYKDKVDWPKIKSEVNQNLNDYNSFQNSLKEVSTIFDFAKADHSRVYYNYSSYASNFAGPKAKDFSAQWQKKFATSPKFEVKVLDNQYGYILMPGMSFEDRSKKNIDKQSQPMYDAINAIKTSTDLKGWIIDLRFNTGGDCMPMILALYDFLGDNEVWGVLDINKTQTLNVKLSKGKYLENGRTTHYINPKGALLDKTKVAVITNMATASSGEVTAMSFKGRENTIFIGDKTYGKTTTNRIADLAFTAYMTVTVGYDCDRNGNFYDQMIPDISVVKQDNFDNLLQDKNIQEAIKFITTTD